MPDSTTAPQAAANNQDIVEKTKQYLEKKKGAGQSVAPATNATGGTPTGDNASAVAGAAGGTVIANSQNSGQTSQQTQASKPISVRGMTNVLDAMFAKGLIDQETLKSIKFEAVTTNLPALKILQNKNLVTNIEVQQIKAEMYGIPYIDLQSVSIEQETLNKLPKDVAIKQMAIVFEETNNRYKVAMEDPLDLQKVKFLEAYLGKRVDSYYANPDTIKSITDTRYGAQIGNVVDRALQDIGAVDIREAAEQGELDNISIEGAPVAKIVNMILDYAIKHEASDIHIEPREGKLAVRFRIHGLLAEKLTLPPELANSIVARIKILCNMRIDEHRIPQDNRFQVKAENGAVDVRVSVMPSIYGEKVVMRILEKEKGIMQIPELGMRGPTLKAYQSAIKKTQGIILITGPVGSGKTVTLASTLSTLNTQQVNIMTLEDPVEVRINGITQVQINPDVGLTFASGLRSFLRQDPDIIMVGEIRDTETARLAVQAALVGRLVLATLHTNSAAGALPRLLDIGVEPYLLSSTINAVCGQRLVRKLCDKCKQPYKASPEVVALMHKELDPLHGFELKNEDTNQQVKFDSKTQDLTLYKPVGCQQCNNEGYDGRVGIFEVMTVTEKIGRMLMQTSSSKEIQNLAVSEGMITMAQDGFMKALEGLTTVEEVLRVQTI